jgi:hypothetical protein
MRRVVAEQRLGFYATVCEDDGVLSEADLVRSWRDRFAALHG